MAGHRDRDGFRAKLSARSAPRRLATSEILDEFADDDGVSVKDGVPSLRFETRNSASMLFRAVDIDLAAYPMLAWRWYIELPIKSPLDERTREGDDHPARLFLRFVTDRGEKCAMEVIWGNRLKPGTINTSAAFRTLSPMPATIGSAAGSTRGSISSASMPRSGRMPHPRTWSMSPCSAIATTRTPPASATSPMFGSNGGEVLAARRAPGCLTPQGGCCRTPQGSNLVEPASAIARGDDGGRRLAPTTAERTVAGRRSLPFLTRWAVPCSPDLIP